MLGRMCSVALVMLSVSCSTAQIERRTLPAAIADHVASLPRFDPSAHVIVPPGLAWNAALEAVRGFVPIARVDAMGHSLLTHYHYEDALAAGVRTQTRTFYDVRFRPDARRGFTAEATASSEARARGVCGGESPFTPVAADATAVTERARHAIAELAHAPVEDFVFEANPGALANALLGTESIYVITLGYGPDGAPVVEATGRASAAQRRDVIIEVQSRYRATFLPAENGGTRVRVEAVLEHRTSDDDALGDFQQDDPARIVEGVYGMLASLAPVRDLVLEDSPMVVATDEPPIEPALLHATDDLHGRFEVRAQLYPDPRTRRDEAFWSQATNVYVVVEAAGQRVVSDSVADGRSGPPRALALDLAGDAPIQIALASSPLTPDATTPVAQIALASTRAAELLLACRPVCFEGDGGQICLTLTRP